MSQTAKATTSVLSTSSGRIPQVSTLAKQVHSATLWQLIRNEAFKMRHYRLVWSLLALNLSFVVVAWILITYFAIFTPSAFLPGQLLNGTKGLIYSVGLPLALSRRAGNFIAVALGALIFGGEFSSGALRMVFSRGVRRINYLLAKYVLLAILGLLLILAELLLSLLLCNLLIFIHNPAPTLLNIDGETISDLLKISLGSYENYLCCLLLGAAFGIITCSAAFGTAIGFIYLVSEEIVSRFLPIIGKTSHTNFSNQIINLLFTPNLNAFYTYMSPGFLVKTLYQLNGITACNQGAQACLPVGGQQSLFVTLIWILLLGGTSTYLFIRRDIL